jgi:hypothetical protein
MLKWMAAAVLAAMSMSVHAATMIRYQAYGPASGVYQIYGDGSPPVQFNGTIFVEAWFPAEHDMGYWCTPPLTCEYTANRVIGRYEGLRYWSTFELLFDHQLDGMPQSNAGFIGGTAIGNVAGLSMPDGSGGGDGTLTHLYVTVFDDVTSNPGVSVWIVPSAVPEPATWMFMIAGFGMLGVVMRCQRRRPSIKSRSTARAISI